MNLKTLASAATLLCTLAPLTLASAQSSGTYVFETVDSIEAGYWSNTFKLTGILQGEAAPRTISFDTSEGMGSEQMIGFIRVCERFALISMNKPGQYYLEVRRESGYSSLTNCKLTRR
ncbi:hypothetical protein F0U62_02660 [Cystobacter fuscus]|uniref:hypothetical protein n=1 Tax=Cystobacter fuscus TaxID=43 RepID=UPI002B3228BB|nr:hypothetical protein F0U62_02660 [Cystobacter fuscus]